MKQVFRSKYSWWMVVVILAAAFAGPVIIAFAGFVWWAFLITLFLTAFFLDMLINTSYTIDGDKLVLRAGSLFRSTIDISKIKSIAHKHTCINDNSFAWSTDRLVIEMPRRTKYMVSPKRESDFINSLLQINPQIIVEK